MATAVITMERGMVTATESPILRAQQLGLDVAYAQPPEGAGAGRRGTEEIVTDELDLFDLEVGDIPRAAASTRERRSLSTAPMPFHSRPFPGPTAPSIADQLGIRLSDTVVRTTSWTAGRDAAVAGSPTAARRVEPSVFSPGVRGMGQRQRSRTTIARPAEDARGGGALRDPLGYPGAADDSADDLVGLARNLSATSFADLQSMMQRIQSDVERMDACVICGEFGRCAPFSCCKTPRHLRCEMDFAKANRLRWRLATATVRADGTKAFKRLRPPATEAEYAAQLGAAGPDIYQLIPCSVCRKPLAAVRALGEFAPPPWHDIHGLREEQAARNVVAMRGAHPYTTARGASRVAILAGYSDASQAVRWQGPWLCGVVFVAAMVMFVLSYFNVSGSVGDQLAITLPCAFVAVLMCWICVHWSAVARTRRELEEEASEERAVAAGGSIASPGRTPAGLPPLGAAVAAPPPALLPASALVGAADRGSAENLLRLHARV